VTNTGNLPLNGTVTDVLSTNLTFASASPTNKPGPWTFTNLAPGSTKTYYLNATVKKGVVSATVPRLNLVNYANVTAKAPNEDSVKAENRANVTVYYVNDAPEFNLIGAILLAAGAFLLVSWRGTAR
jgi:hypothetical protein